MLIEIVWDITVKANARSRFELAYGPGGAWSRLFSKCPGFRGITMLRDTRHPQRYLIVEFWTTVAQREQALSEHRKAYTDLETTLNDWTESRYEVGIFQVRTEATVHPRRKPPQSKTR